MNLGYLIALVWSVVAISVWTTYSAMEPTLSMGRVVRRRVARTPRSEATALATAEIIYLRDHPRA